MSELICTCYCGGTMFYRHLHAPDCLCATQGDEAPESHPDNIAALRTTLAQQAQEIERLKRDNRLLNEHITCCRAENAEKLSQLAAMTAERDEACGELLVSLDDAPIGSLAGKLVTANRVLRSHLATLQATLAERDAYKAVLQGAEYEQVDKIGTLSVEVAQRIGVTAAHRTKEIVAQLAAAQARIAELKGKV